MRMHRAGDVGSPGRLAAAILACLGGANAVPVPAQEASGFPMVDPALGPAPDWKPGAPLPGKVQGTVVVSVSSQEAIGVFNAPSCQAGSWALTADLALKLVRKDEETAEYQASGGWKVAGRCSGFFAQDFPSGACTVTVDGKDDGAGSLAGAAGSARLTFHRDTGLFELNLAVTGKSTRAWQYVCSERLPWPRTGTHTAEAPFVAGLNGHVLVRERDLAFDVGGSHAWVNDQVDGRYTRTSGGFLGSGLDCEYLRKEIERTRKRLDESKLPAEVQQRLLLAADPMALAEVAGWGAQGPGQAGDGALASSYIQREMVFLPGVNGADGESYFRSLEGYLSANPMPLPLSLDPAVLPLVHQGQALRSRLASLEMEGRVSRLLLEAWRRQLARCTVGK